MRLLVLFTLSIAIVLAQNVGIGTATPDPSAKLEINSNNSGLLIPRLTTAQRDAIASPAHGVIILNIDNFCLEIYNANASAWQKISCPDNCVPPACSPTITGPDVVCPGATVSYTASGCASSTVSHQWTVPAGWTINSGQGSTTINVTAGSNNGNITVQVCNNCGCGPNSTYGVNVMCSGLTGWIYYRTITITNNTANNYTNIPVKITFDSQSLVSAGKLQAGCEDLRFRLASDCSSLCHWVEEGTENTTATDVWIKIPSLPANSTAKVYMIYGNSTATNVEDGNCVFDTFFDDFSQDPNTNGKWTVFRYSNDVNNEFNWDGIGSVYLTRALNWKACMSFMNITLSPVDYVFEFRYKIGGGAGGADGIAFAFDKDIAVYSSAGGCYAGGRLGLTTWNGTVEGLSEGYAVEWDNYFSNPSDPSYEHIGLGNTKTGCVNPELDACYHLQTVNAGSINDNTWHEAKVTIQSSGAVLVDIDGSNMLSAPSGSYSPLGYNKHGFGAGTGGLNNNHQLDWVIVYPITNTSVSLGGENAMCP